MSELSEDLMEGVAAISEFHGTSTRRGFYLVQRGMIPAFKIGNVWYARKSTCLAHIVRLEAERQKANGDQAC